MEWFTDHGVRDLTVLNFFVRFFSANGDMHSNCLLMEGWEVCEVLLNLKIRSADK